MQAKNLKIKVEEFYIIPVQIIHCFEIYIVHADIGISKSFISTKNLNPNVIIKTIIKNVCFVFCHHLDHLKSQK